MVRGREKEKERENENPLLLIESIGCFLSYDLLCFEVFFFSRILVLVITIAIIYSDY